MTGPERVPRPDIRFSPFTPVVIEPYNIPGSSKSSKKKDDAPQPPRPQNAWILYRAWALSNLFERQPELKGTPQSQLSKILGSQWANESPEIRKHFEHQANLNKERHAQEFPDYVFKPQKKEEKEREREKKKQEKARDREAAKLRKEVEKNMRAGYLPPFMMSRPTIEVLQKLAFIKFADLGPSPPISQCPSPEITNVPIGDEPLVVVGQGTSSTTTGLTSPEADETSDSGPAPSTPDTQLLARTSDVDQHSASVLPSVPTPSQPNNTLVLDAPTASSSSSDAPPDWAKYGVSTMSEIEEFLSKAFAPEPVSSECNRCDMPSGNILPSPGFVESAQQRDDLDFSGLVSIPLDESVGMLDEQHDCHLANPHAEQGPSSSSFHDQDQQGSKEAMFMEPFVQVDVSLGHLLAAAKEVGSALLDEQEASATGERVIATEYVQDGAPATCVERCAPSSFLPSPPESSSSATSPLGPALFDFVGATNLCASSSNQDAFGSLGFSDSMSNTDSTSSVWSLPSFSDFGGYDNYAFGSMGADASTSALQLSMSLEENTKKIDTGIPNGYLSDAPPTPISATPWKTGGFDIGEIVMADFSSLNATMSSANDPQRQIEDAWLSSYFNEPGSGPV